MNPKKTIEEHKEFLLKRFYRGGFSDRYIELLPKNDEIRNVIISFDMPYFAYLYAYYVDKEPRDDTRNLAIQKPNLAYMYARYVDKGPRDDTRNATLLDPEAATYYATYVDQCYREDTYKAVKKACRWGSRHPWLAIYQIDVPNTPLINSPPLRN